MKILALEFSAPLRSVALGTFGAGSFQLLGRADERPGQATRAFAMIDEVLRQAGVARQAIDGLAVGLGPGSYAGIRVSLAIAQGWQLATGVSTTGVGSVNCLAETARTAGQRGPVSIAVDAQRGEAYLADFRLTDTASEEVAPVRIVARAEVDRIIAAGGVVLGPDVRTMFPDAKELFPDATVLARLASGVVPGESAESLEPIYLRTANFVKAPVPVRTF